MVGINNNIQSQNSSALSPGAMNSSGVGRAEDNNFGKDLKSSILGELAKLGVDKNEMGELGKLSLEDLMKLMQGQSPSRSGGDSGGGCPDGKCGGGGGGCKGCGCPECQQKMAKNLAWQ